MPLAYDVDAIQSALDALNKQYSKSGGSGVGVVLLPSSNTVVDRRYGAPREMTIESLLAPNARAADAEPRLATKATATTPALGNAGFALLMKLLGYGE